MLTILHYAFLTRVAEHDVYDLQALHEKHGPLVRYGSDQVSVADWEAYKTIYMGQNSSFLKDPIFYRGFYVSMERNRKGSYCRHFS